MSELIETTLKTAAAEGKNTLRHDIGVELESEVIINACLQAWGESLRNSRAAPSWSRVTPFIDRVNGEDAQLSMAVDHEGAGALALSFSAPQRLALTELLEELKALAVNAEAPEASITAAQTAFNDKLASYELSEAFGPAMGPLAVSSFLDNSQTFALSFEHKEFGSLEARDLHALAKQHALKPQAILDAEEAAEKAAAEQAGASGASASAAQAAAPKRYSSLGQILKAGDSAAMEKIIKDHKEMERWDSSMKDNVTQLLWHAAGMGHVDIARILMDEGEATMDHMNASGVTPLLAACAGNQPAMIDFLLSRGAELSETTVDGKTPLMVAAEADAVAAIQKLVDLGADIDETALDGRTALHFAALGVNETTAAKSVTLLMELGADPTLADQISGHIAEEYISEEFDEVFANLGQYRKDFESGAVKPRASSPISKARAILGF